MSNPPPDSDTDHTGETTRPDGGTVTDSSTLATSGKDSSESSTQALMEPFASDTVRHAFRRISRHVGAITVTEYRLAVRGRWALALTGLFTIFGAMIVTFSGSAIGPDGMHRVIASLTSLAAYLVPLAALTLGYDAIVGRESEGWLAVVFSLPVKRSEVVLGGYLGRLVVLAGAAIIGFGFTGFLLFREYGGAEWMAFVGFLGATVAVGAVFLSVAVLLSTVAREKTYALGLALLAWVWFVLVHDLIALGVLAAFRLPDIVVSALVLANPVSVFRVLVLTQLGTAAGGGFTVALAGTGLSVGVLIGTLIVWCVLPLVLAMRLVDRRRL